MKTLVLRRRIFLSLGIYLSLGVLFMFIFAIYDSSRRLPKSQNPNQISDLENVQMDCPDVQACDQETEQFISQRLETKPPSIDETFKQRESIYRRSCSLIDKLITMNKEGLTNESNLKCPHN